MTFDIFPWGVLPFIFLVWGEVAAFGAALGTSAKAGKSFGPENTAPLRPFRLDEVRLGNGLLQEKRDRIKRFLREYDERRYLVLFNNQAGRPNPSDVNVPGGWEDGGLLSGHWAGHFMTALSQAYADQGELVYKTKLDWMVAELAACQDAITARMDEARKTTKALFDNSGREKGKFGKALRLGGSSQARFVTLPQETINQLQDFTIAAWVNLGSNQTWSRLFDFGHDTSINMFLTPRSGAVENAPRFAITIHGSEQEERIEGGTVLSIGKWTHLAVVLNNSQGLLYVDGKISGTNMGMTLNPTMLDNPGNRWIGRSQYGDAMLDAAVDEFQIFNRALTEDEIQSLQGSAAGSTNGGNVAWYRFDEGNGTTLKDSSPHSRDAGVVMEDDDSEANWVPTHPGYLGALPEDTVLRLGPPRWAVYGGDKNTNTWAPWYTQHKIMRGLLDAYYNTNNSQALDVVMKMADWAHLALTVGDKNHPKYQGNLTRDDLNYMWDLYIAGEFGGANEVLAEIFALTGDTRHLTTARAFDNRESLFDAAVEDRDILAVTPGNKPGRRRPERLHANTHVPQFLGYMRIYEQGGGDDYLHAAKNFYGWVVPHREFASGGTGGNYPGSNDNTELFQNRGNIANAISYGGAETCTSYNMLKLARNLFMHEHKASYIDNYERGLLNMIAGSRKDADSDTDPLITYFQPLSPASRRAYGNTGTCCGGTGLESHTKYQETVYMHSADSSAIWINLYIPSSLTWEEKQFSLKQETDFPRGDTSKLTITGQGWLDIRLRVPGWAKTGFHIEINGLKKSINSLPGTYVTLSEDWKKGDVIEVKMPRTIRTERALDRPDVQAFMHGPVLLQILGSPADGTDFWKLSLYRHLKLDGDYSRAAVKQTTTTPSGDPQFTIMATNLTVRPYYISDSQPVSSYFQRVEPQVVFGKFDTGVPNLKRNDHLPQYDVPVTGIPSPGSDGPTFLDILWDQAPFASHSAFVKSVSAITDTFVSAGIYSSQQQTLIIEAANAAENELALDD